MPDTGAPWNLPYPAPSGLVRDAPAAFEDLADAVAAKLTAASTLQQVVNVRTTTAIAIGTIFTVDTITFTPLSASSTIVVEWIGAYTSRRVSGSPTNRKVFFTIQEDGTRVAEHYGGRELVGSSSAIASMDGLIRLKYAAAAGSTSARDYTTVIGSPSDVEVASIGPVGFPPTQDNLFIVTEFAASIL